MWLIRCGIWNCTVFSFFEQKTVNKHARRVIGETSFIHFAIAIFVNFPSKDFGTSRKFFFDIIAIKLCGPRYSFRVAAIVSYSVYILLGNITFEISTVRGKRFRTVSGKTLGKRIGNTPVACNMYPVWIICEKSFTRQIKTVYGVCIYLCCTVYYFALFAYRNPGRNENASPYRSDLRRIAVKEKNSKK